MHFFEEKMKESNRIKKLQRDMIKAIPLFPNTKETREELVNSSFSHVLNAYFHWKSRIIPDRKRKTALLPSLTQDKRWKILKSSIKALLDRVENGLDINPFLSEKAHKKGYTSHSNILSQQNIWLDKDQILNLHHYHHFHLNMHIKDNNISERTEYLLFAEISREKFTAIGIFDHTVFDDVLPDSINMERKRLLDIHYKRITQFLPYGSHFLSSSQITATGHPIHIRKWSNKIANILVNNDNKLDNRIEVNAIYTLFNKPPPDRFNFEWQLIDLDLYLHNKKTGEKFLYYKSYL